jgi:hypothetical protein
VSYNTIGNGDFLLLSNGFNTLPDGSGILATVVSYGDSYSFITTEDGCFLAFPVEGVLSLPNGTLFVTDVLTDTAPVPSGSGTVIPYFYFIKKYKAGDMISYALTDTTLIEGMGGYSFPMTITLNSAEAGRKIEISTNGQKAWDELTPDITATDHISVAVFAPITHFRVTGAVSDTVDIVN